MLVINFRHRCCFECFLWHFPAASVGFIASVRINFRYLRRWYSVDSILFSILLAVHAMYVPFFISRRAARRFFIFMDVIVTLCLIAIAMSDSYLLSLGTAPSHFVDCDRIVSLVFCFHRSSLCFVVGDRSFFLPSFTLGDRTVSLYSIDSFFFLIFLFP